MVGLFSLLWATPRKSAFRMIPYCLTEKRIEWRAEVELKPFAAVRLNYRVLPVTCPYRDARQQIVQFKWRSWRLIYIYWHHDCHCLSFGEVPLPWSDNQPRDGPHIIRSCHGWLAISERLDYRSHMVPSCNVTWALKTDSNVTWALKTDLDVTHEPQTKMVPFDSGSQPVPFDQRFPKRLTKRYHSAQDIKLKK